ncbi:hypothetical protein KZP23_22540 [Echinicola marina]|uniref:hypothetical protein n=1 Tax=Echinicola marina TaxID=2859768 RepID=UPI001CF6BB86|nr:hypothetical protein [Echinicola marina]UCS93386.1 hypothetical protein KZP23_22540 [Echinicola marina]
MLLTAVILFCSEEELKPVYDTLPHGEILSKVEMVALKGKAQYRPFAQKIKKHSNEDDHQRVKNFFIRVCSLSLGKNTFDANFLFISVDNPIFDLAHVFIGRAPPYRAIS